MTAIDGGKMDGWANRSAARRANARATPPSNRRRSLPLGARWPLRGAIERSPWTAHRALVGGHLDFFAQTLDGFVGKHPTQPKAPRPSGLRLGMRLAPRCRRGRPASPSAAADAAVLHPATRTVKVRIGPTPVPYVPTIADRLEVSRQDLGHLRRGEPRRRRSTALGRTNGDLPDLRRVPVYPPEIRHVEAAHSSQTRAKENCRFRDHHSELLKIGSVTGPRASTTAPRC